MNTQPAIEELVNQGREALKQRDYPKAIQAFETALAQSENRTDILSMLATTCFVARNYQQAVQHFLRITQLDPSDGKARINLGAVYNRMGEFQKAVDSLRQGLRKERSSAEAYYNLGIAYRGQGQSSMAISAYREAIRFNPAMADAYQNLANLYSEMGNTQLAVNHYKKALEIKPDFERARAGLSKALGEASEARQAESPFGRLVDLEKYAGEIATEPVREMSDTERFEDRQHLYQLVKEMRIAAEEFLTHTRNGVIPALLSLGRSVATVTDDPYEVEKPFRTFQEVVARSQECRRALRRKVLELRAHEELMNTPPLSQ